MSEKAPSPTMHDLMARVGYLLLYWGFLEAALAGRNLVELTADHRREFDRLRALRNLVAHGIVRASADPRSPPTFIVCVCADRTHETTVEYSELVEAADAIDRLRHALL
jgi:hypothetical protein